MRRDWWMCAAVMTLAVFGLLVQVRLAGSLPTTEGLLPFAAGIVCFIACAIACGDGRAGAFLEGKGKWVAFWLAAALMAALLVFGHRYRGGLYLPGRINPSELVKLCMAAFLAGWLGGKSSTVKGLALCGVLMLTVAAAGDFGMVAQLVLSVAAILWAASWAWGTLAVVGVAGGMLLAAANPAGHLATRFAVWKDPFADMTGSGWQTLQGLAAILSGGYAGSGFGLGEVQAVPIVASDFVYAALAEELGLSGCAAVLALWAFVLFRGIRTAVRRADKSPCEALLAAGIVSSLAVQAMLNVAGVLNVLPMTGITLPLISLGGSSLVTTLAMCGVLAGMSGPFADAR